ncbi:MAG: alpha/beta fold hydrolase [Solirubrobacteraceae bacterium]
MTLAASGRAEITLHGHRVSYRTGGTPGAPLLVLVHGITNSSATWEPILPLLEPHCRYIAPDLLGHGESDKPRGDYSLGAAASLLRDLLLAFDHERATIVGHSLGGGIAMQFAYQFPERVERLALVGSGGLGREVSLLLRAATLPGAEYVLPLLVSDPLINAGEAVGRALGKVGLRVGRDIGEMAAGLASLRDIEARKAFVHTARSVIDVGGQLVDASDRLYLAEAMPTLIVWGTRDPVIPAEHGIRAHGLMPGSRLELFDTAGHFPHHDEPVAFAAVLRDFVQTTQPARLSTDRLRELIVERRQQSAAA